MNRTIAIAKGDGIGPEIMEATLGILKAAECPINYEEVLIGEQAYLSGNTSGIGTEAWDIMRQHRILLKAPITTPQGGGYKSLNVTLRKSMGLFANVRPCVSYVPFVDSKHPKMDMVIVRENEEDLYAGIEHQQTDDVVQCLKLISAQGSEKIIRYAFEYARAYGRKKVTCFSKDNIMKQTDGLFHRIFDEVSQEYPEIENSHMIIDIGAARVADTPEMFDVIVTPNLYGDIISDIAAQISGSVGIAGSANIGQDFAMFEAIHGSAPDIAGKNIANPSGLLHGAIQMLVHCGFTSHAETIFNAWLCALESGMHTADIYRDGQSIKKVGTKEFADIIIAHLGKKPTQLRPAQLNENVSIHVTHTPIKKKNKQLLGVDVFVDASDCTADELAVGLQKSNTSMSLNMITNRGVKVWPQGFPETFCTNHWRCRFLFDDEASNSKKELIVLLGQLTELGIDVIKTENLYSFDGKLGFSLGQGQ
jgi:isocitrate dehydrogenase